MNVWSGIVHIRMEFFNYTRIEESMSFGFFGQFFGGFKTFEFCRIVFCPLSVDKIPPNPCLRDIFNALCRAVQIICVTQILVRLPSNVPTLKRREYFWLNIFSYLSEYYILQICDGSDYREWRIPIKVHVPELVVGLQVGDPPVRPVGVDLVMPDNVVVCS